MLGHGALSEFALSEIGAAAVGNTNATEVYSSSNSLLNAATTLFDGSSSVAGLVLTSATTLYNANNSVLNSTVSTFDSASSVLNGATKLHNQSNSVLNSATTLYNGSSDALNSAVTNYTSSNSILSGATSTFNSSSSILGLSNATTLFNGSFSVLSSATIYFNSSFSISTGGIFSPVYLPSNKSYKHAIRPAYVAPYATKADRRKLEKQQAIDDINAEMQGVADIDLTSAISQAKASKNSTKKIIDSILVNEELLVSIRAEKSAIARKVRTDKALQDAEDEAIMMLMFEFME